MRSQAVIDWKEGNSNFKKIHSDWETIGNICSYSCKVALSKEMFLLIVYAKRENWPLQNTKFSVKI